MTLPVINSQPVEKWDPSDGSTLDVVDTFRTIQGEGPFAGRPAVFVRLAGCNLQCPMCDTDYTTGRERRSVRDLMATVELLSRTRARRERNTFVGTFVVLTGGEPLRQRIAPFLDALLAIGSYTVQIETNGTLYDGGLETVWSPRLFVVCSPKALVNPRLKPRIGALKYVLRAGAVSPDDGLPTTVLGSNVPPERPWPGFEGGVYVAPEDEGDAERNLRNREEAVRVCLEYNYILSLQQHKIVGVP